ncbi:Transcriptional regulatory protein ZraR [Fundidesulfovibrio magnetotacticus]|uniref:Transcriptional regulatory protein ZraR n=1 Tax=Fundidesulfovibrio magnetotacticus TaxID=2730080 RepID=A0A6V8LUG5_9BACT|nr:sigma-54 dependent transcriptional regulator [Fundidesulfovibrio magnetotacticus]GFK93287.1 Transcriptional regulatory protein ZraR [Fundidesulfovibrio magnetotacticus]
MPGKTILFVAQAHAITSLFPMFKGAGIEAGIADSLPGAMAWMKKNRPAVIFTQAKIGGAYQAETLLAAARESGDFPPVIVFTARGSAQEAQSFMEQGARDYWLEPLDWEKIEAVLPRDAQDDPAPLAAPAAPLAAKAPVQAAAAVPAAARAMAAPQGVQGERFSIIGGHPAILRVLALARQVARSKATVLISGESGTGKEMFARFLHAHSDRAARPFVALNCAALPEHLLESELFGHEKGAFTGAIARKLGKFELAQGGTILLDEISEMDLGLQAKLLRVLQEGEFDRVGGVETVGVDVRVLATTNRRLEQYVEEGKFRQDLYYRLNVIPLKLPPLRERGGDILGLAGFFVDKFRKAYGLGRLDFSAAARDWLLAHDWPGNVRELQNLMERAVLLAGDGPIDTVHFLLEGDEFPLAEEQPVVSMERVTSLSAPPEEPQAPGAEGHLPPGIVPLDVLERQMILKSLDQTSGNRTQAALLLGISVRTLRNKLSEYRQQGLEVP